MRLRVLLLFLLIPLTAHAQQIALKQIASGLQNPVAITHANDNRLFITLQPGQIVIYDGTRILSQPFLDIRSLVRFGGEQGLLSVAFHPRYSENGFFYVYYVN